jgi:hypothetical protein
LNDVDDLMIPDTFGADTTRKRHIWHAREQCILAAHD